jgi:hypothetical protein
MKSKGNFSRRDFMKSSALATTAVVGVGAVSGCQSSSIVDQKPLRQFLGASSEQTKGITGLLFSQVGYELGLPVRVIVRLPKQDMLSAKAVCRLSAAHASFKTSLNYWGEIWGSHWWVADFTDVNKEGVYAVEVLEGKELVYADEGLLVKKDILWDSTIEWASVDMLERRRHFTKVGAGWQDAGTLWVESPAQSGMVISLEDLLEKSTEKFDVAFIYRIYAQISVGCDYLMMTQHKAKELGYADGAFSHDLHGHEHDVLLNDGTKAAVALFRAARLLPDEFSDKKKNYLDAANKAYNWLQHTARPAGLHGYEPVQRGLPKDTAIPKDEWLTRDLLMMCWAALEKWKIDKSEDTIAAAALWAGRVLERQIPKEQAVMGFYGNFREFSSLPHSESSWVHGIKYGDKGVEFGADIGGFYPNYLMPIIEMLRLWPEHQDADKWKATLTDFTEGYLKPACNANPFKIVPLAIFENEGPIWFCGTFHGSNAIYGYTAALALELAELLEDASLRDIAYGNLQWIAGLNSGITRENLVMGSVVYSADIPDGVALPASMICHIGNRWAGTWFQTRGVVCNGFSNGEQFKFDIPVKMENDAPNSFTDEDWIPHSAGWVTGLTRLHA